MDDREVLLEQYKVFVETTSKVSAFRASANNFFIAINTALIALFPIVLDKTTGVQEEGAFLIVIGIMGLIINMSWFLTIKTYKALNSAKFKAVKEMERQLPVQPFEVEWKELRSKKWYRKYLTLTGVEIFLPLVMLLPYVALFFFHPPIEDFEILIESEMREENAVLLLDDD